MGSTPTTTNSPSVMHLVFNHSRERPLSYRRAGPGTQFSIIGRVRGGAEVDVLGCLADHLWCDVDVYGLRGWISSRRLAFSYAQRQVLLPDYYDYFNAPVIGFEFGFGEVNGHHHRYDRRERHRDNLTECLAPEGFCPGDRSGQFHSGGRNHRGGSGFSDSTVSSGNAELHIAPGADSSAGRRGSPPPTECLAPEGFCR